MKKLILPAIALLVLLLAVAIIGFRGESAPPAIRRGASGASVPAGSEPLPNPPPSGPPAARPGAPDEPGRVPADPAPVPGDARSEDSTPPPAPGHPVRRAAEGEVPPRPLTYETNVGADGEFPEFWQDPGAEGLPDREKTDLLHIAVTRDSVTLNNEIVKRLPFAERAEEIPPGPASYQYRLIDGSGKHLHEGRFIVPALCEQCPPGQPDHVRGDPDQGQNEGLQSGGVVFQHRVDMMIKLPYLSQARLVEFRRRDSAGTEAQVGAIRLHRE